MTSRIENLTIDSATPFETAAFWAEALGWQITGDDEDEVALCAPAGSPEAGVLPDLLFIRVPEGKTVKNRLHLDVRPDDQGAEVARLEALGATQIDIAQGQDATWVVMADPEGNEFCVLRALPADESKAP